MIPIALIVSLEIVKAYQMSLMAWNDALKSEDQHCKVNSMSVNEELGQIEYVLSDKTGTLTCNKMEFIGCNIGGVLYGIEFKMENDYEKITTSLKEKGIEFIDCTRKEFDAQLDTI